MFNQFFQAINQHYTLSFVLGSSFVVFCMAIFLTPIYTNLAFRFRWWKKIRNKDILGKSAPVFYKLNHDKHERKIPTMAGIVMIVAITIITMLTNWSRGETYLPVAALLFAGSLGLLDDVINLIGSNRDGRAGLSPLFKFSVLLIIALAMSFYFYFKLGYSSVSIPFLNQVDLGFMYIPLAAFIILSTGIAVNTTDGLDGLAGGLLIIVFGALAIVSYAQGLYSLSAFCGACVGALTAYTWFNIYPARFFMGDVGAYALGTTLAVVALLTDSAFIMPIIGGIFVAEAGSVVIQIFYRKLMKKKFFIASPLHLHLQALGWHETRVTMRFWLLGVVLGLIGVAIKLIS